MNEDVVVKDPVCEMEKPIFQMPVKSEYKGKIYYFCSQTDKEMFDANPDHWVEKEEET